MRIFKEKVLDQRLKQGQKATHGTGVYNKDYISLDFFSYKVDISFSLKLWI